MANLQIEISIGEAIDRLTILKIKLTKIKNYDQLKNIRTEHDLLEKAIHKFYPEAPIFPLRLDSIFGDLYKVNEELWDVEDEIRLLERDKNFGAKFIELARKVYVTNDKRAKIKKQINLNMNSNLIEEKSYAPY